MAPMTPPQEPQSAAEYDDRTTAAVKSVLIEIGQILGSFKGKFAIIGGTVPGCWPMRTCHTSARSMWTSVRTRRSSRVAVAGAMPDGGTNRGEIAVCSIPARLAMKGHALAGRYKQKDAYDIDYCVRNYPDGIELLAQECLRSWEMQAANAVSGTSPTSST